MASTLVDQVGRRQPVTPPSKPALFAYSDSDTKTSSDAPDRQARSSDDLMAAEVLTALSVAKANSIEYVVNDNPTSTSAGMNQHKKAATNKFEPIVEGSGRSGQAEIVCKTVNDDDDTIPDVDETQHVEFETTFIEANEVDGSNDRPRCWGDIKHPRVGTCNHEFKIVNKGERYRKVVSDFFGRNKKATASVPPDYYPTICRACYQRLVYRLGSMNKDEPEKNAAAVAKLRCDAIIAALEKMKKKKFVDRNGHEWPWWCGLELQLTNDGQALLETPELLEAEIEKKNGEVAKQKAEKAKSPKGKSFKRLHKRVKPEHLPDWLQKLCQANTEDAGANNVATSTIGDRNGVRYSFDELILIIKAVKTFCHESRCAFPTIEAIPVSIGLLDEQIVKEKRKLRAAANKMKSDTKKAVVEAERQARDQPNNSFRKKIASNKRKEANDALAEADARERDVDHAQEDALMSAATIPGKRRKSDVTPGRAGKVRIDLMKMKAEKVVESTTRARKGHDDDGEYGQSDDGDVEVDASTPPARRARISKKPERKNYKAWVIKKYGSWPPPPAADVAGVRARMAEARRDGYGPAAVRRIPGEPYMSEIESESE